MRAMNEREQRGLQIAAVCRIDQKGDVWLVPSQSGKEKYKVTPHPESPHCTCLDHETRGLKCKHIFAVEFARKRWENPDGSTTTAETILVSETKRKKYSKNWPAYIRAI